MDNIVGILFIILITMGTMIMWNLNSKSKNQTTDGMQKIQLIEFDFKHEQCISLFEALSLRKSTRSFTNQPLQIDMLSQLLWSAFGINRENLNERTAPSAFNTKDIQIFVAMSAGVYLFDANSFTLKPVLNKDIRILTGGTGIAPIELLYTSEQSKWNNLSKREKNLYSAAGAGFIGQNVYLYCASKGLASVIRGSINRSKLTSVLNLSSSQKVLLIQSVGFTQKGVDFNE
jgi:hypothetical protein